MKVAGTMSGKWHAAILAFLLAGCAANSTALAEAIVAKDKIETNGLDAFQALVEQGNATPDVKAWYLSHIAQDRAAQRMLTDNALALCDAIGKVDWQAAALQAWKLIKAGGK